jgi:hypothetical protein
MKEVGAKIRANFGTLPFMYKVPRTVSKDNILIREIRLPEQRRLLAKEYI